MSTATPVKQLPLPDFYDPKSSEKWGYRPDEAMLFEKAQEWAKQHDVAPAGADKFRVHLLLIDVQKDFCFPEGALYVGGRSGRGAIEDSARTAEFIYKNLPVVTDVTCTMDTHFPFQVFFPSFWVDDETGAAPDAHTTVSTQDISEGRLKPNPAMAKWLCNGNYTWLVSYVKHYCQELERAGKYQLYLWPFHCLLGAEGHALAGAIAEARAFHSFVRASKGDLEVKGGALLTENYSVLRPEVLATQDHKPVGQKNTRFLNTLLGSDAVIIAGQAASHCVKFTIDDLLSEIRAQDESLARKCYIMEDCMSSVAIPDGQGGFVADFTDDAAAAIKKFKDAGMHVVKSTDPIENWEGISL